MIDRKNRKEEKTMKIVIINGSARKGNTTAAIDAFVKGASAENEIEIIQEGVRYLRIEGAF